MMHEAIQRLHQAASAHVREGKTPQAEATLRELIQSDANYAPAHYMLGALAHRSGRMQEALQHLNRALAIDPAVPEPMFLIGLILQQQRQLPKAIEAYRNYLVHMPDDGRALNNLGRALLDTGQVTEGKNILDHAVLAAPKNAGAHSNLGDAFRMMGDTDSAAAQYRRAIAIDENCGEAYCNMGILLANKNQLAQSIASFQRAIAINPRSFNARFNLTRILQDATELDESVTQCRLAIELRPNSGEAHNVLGNLMGIMGEVPQCITAQRRAVQLQPDHAANHSNLLLSLQYRDDISKADRFAAHRQWDQQHISRHSPIALHRKPRQSNQRLRIGYVSPNLQAHSVAYFFEPVLAERDRDGFEIFCYSNTTQPDSTTDRFRALAHHWRDISMMRDPAVAAMIAEDEIDILVDLAGHTAGNRLPVFGYKPAPIQVTWLGYPDTTGMVAMDYRLTDAIADPPGENEQWHTEKLIRIRGGNWAYLGVGTGPDSAPPLSSPPAKSNGFITFGSFNNLPKVSPEVLEVWATILHELPHSRLLMKAAGLRGKIGREFVLRHLQAFGIGPERVDLLGWSPTTASHLELYKRIDIALDTFPYNGTTTTCEALWMGVPVVTFPGDRHVARVGASLLIHSGYLEWIAGGVDDYREKAVKLGSDLRQLETVRIELRNRFKSSQLGNANRLAKELERVYREVWQSHVQR